MIAELKINELLAKNDSINVDEVGEFDDWVEFFNPTDQPLNMSGLYLTDDLTNLTKWKFPDSMDVIMPEGYLLIWCDEDETQGIKHTNFKLNTDGEMLVLTRANGITIIDSISFGAQSSNQSYGRILDGDDVWSIMTPTPEYSNTQLNISKNDIIPRKYYLSQNFPNPFNPTTNIHYSIPRSTFVKITIYDLMGREVARPVNDFQLKGNRSVKWDAVNNQGGSVAGGIYLYKIQAGDFVKTRKMIFLK